MGVFLNFTREDRKILAHCCERTGLNQTELVRKLLTSYSAARLECLDVVSMRGHEYHATPETRRMPALRKHK
jgi:hypothetical protein